MARPTIHRFVNCSDLTDKSALLSDIAPLFDWYEWIGEPRRPTRTLRQNRYFHAGLVRALSDFLRAQDYEDCDEGYAKALIKEKFLRVPIYHPRTGAVMSYVTRGTSDLDENEMSDLIDRTTTWFADRFHIVVEPRPANTRPGVPLIAGSPRRPRLGGGHVLMGVK